MNVVLDASSLISLSESCLFDLLNHLKLRNGINFLISESVFKEAVSRPLTINRFKLSALRVKGGVEQGAIEVVKSSKELNKIISEIEELAENVLSSEEKEIKIIHRGELDALALVKHRNAKALIIDEKITRMFLENVQDLKRLIEKRQKTKIFLNRKRHSRLKKMLPELTVIRSSELIALAFEQGLLEKELTGKKEALEAALYSVKFKGCALSEFEIQEFLKQVK